MHRARRRWWRCSLTTTWTSSPASATTRNTLPRTAAAIASATARSTRCWACSSASTRPTCSPAIGCCPRRFVKSFPMEARGFEIETELTVHALELRVPAAEIRTRYVEGPTGSASKLSTYRDGLRILATMARLFRDVKPLPFFSGLAALFAAFGLALGAGVIVEFMKRARAASADCRPRHWIDADGVAVDRLRHDSPQRGARPPRGQADGVPGRQCVPQSLAHPGARGASRRPANIASSKTTFPSACRYSIIDGGLPAQCRRCQPAMRAARSPVIAALRRCDRRTASGVPRGTILRRRSCRRCRRVRKAAGIVSPQSG